jgi:flagellar hook assembly protein FlgD
MRKAIYNVNGELVRNLEVDRTPGWHEVMWDGTNERGVVASTGLYLTRFMVGSMVTTGKMTMVK